ncbi:MAG: DUF937 domain-containing protein [Pseudomonadota bacterium]
MNLMDLLNSAQGGQGPRALADRFGVAPEQADAVARALLPALSSGLKRKAATPEGAGEIARRMRDTDAEAAFAEPAVARTDKGEELFDMLFGGAKQDVQAAVAEDAASRAGLEQSTAQSMLPALAATVLGALQSRESNDSGLSAMIGGLMGGDDGDAQSASGGSGGGLGGLIGGLAASFGGAGGSQQGGFDLSALNRMFDADGDGSAADDLLERFMGGR